MSDNSWSSNSRSCFIAVLACHFLLHDIINLAIGLIIVSFLRGAWLAWRNADARTLLCNYEFALQNCPRNGKATEGFNCN